VLRNRGRATGISRRGGSVGDFFGRNAAVGIAAAEKVEGVALPIHGGLRQPVKSLVHVLGDALTVLMEEEHGKLRVGVALPGCLLHLLDCRGIIRRVNTATRKEHSQFEAGLNIAVCRCSRQFLDFGIGLRDLGGAPFDGAGSLRVSQLLRFFIERFGLQHVGRQPQTLGGAVAQFEQGFDMVLLRRFGQPLCRLDAVAFLLKMFGQFQLGSRIALTGYSFQLFERTELRWRKRCRWRFDGPCCGSFFHFGLHAANLSGVEGTQEVPAVFR